MVNVDLLVRDKAGRILLSWRDDILCGTGWHIPGGVVRFQETIIERLQKTALNELGCEVLLENPEPEFTEFIRPDGPRERSHFVSFIFHCRLPDGQDLSSIKRCPGEAGYLAFHEKFPENMIPVHHFYSKYFGV
jgi:colanic acid biosynthesis protein WcaH